MCPGDFDLKVSSARTRQYSLATSPEPLLDPGLCLKGRVPSGQSRSGCRAVTGDVKAVGGWAVTGGWECDGGRVLGYGNAFWGRVSAVGRGEGGTPPPLSSDSLS